jgi:anti-sigma factor RsiW
MTTTKSITCREIVELVTGYLEGRLSPIQRRRFQEHLAACEGCSAYLEQMRTTIRLVGRLTEDSIPAPVREALLHAFRNWHAQTRC